MDPSDVFWTSYDEVLGSLGQFAMSDLAACSSKFQLLIRTCRQKTKELVLNKEWHRHQFAGLLQFRHVEVLHIRRCDSEWIPTPGLEPGVESVLDMKRKGFPWDSGLIWQLINYNKSTLRRLVFCDTIRADPEFEDDVDNLQTLDFYFHHLYSCEKLERLEIRKTPPPNGFAVDALARMTFSRLLHLELSAGKTWMIRFDFESFGESLLRLAGTANKLQSLFLTWEMRFEDERHQLEEKGCPFLSLWKQAVFPGLQYLRLEGNISYGEECEHIASFVNRHSQMLKRLQLQLNNETAIYRAIHQGFTCPQEMLPKLTRLPVLQELIVTLPCTFQGNEVYHSSQLPRDNCRDVCLSMHQMKALLPALRCVVFLVDVDYAGPRLGPELAAIELVRVVGECQLPTSPNNENLISHIGSIYFVKHDRKNFGGDSYAGMEHVPINVALADISKGHANDISNALVLDSSGMLAACHFPSNEKGFDVALFRSVGNRLRSFVPPTVLGTQAGTVNR